MANRREFVAEVTAKFKENPRSVLGGHAIPAAVLQSVINRGDVLAKLSHICYCGKGASKGVNGLKKADNFRIFGYDSFPKMNMKARQDIEEFIAELPEADQQTFQNANNILTLVFIPSAPKPEGTSLETEILTGKSEALVFDDAVRQEYRFGACMYLVVCFGDSYFRPIEATQAERKEKINKAKNDKRTPAKIKAEIKAKAELELKLINDEKAILAQKAYALQKQHQQLSGLGDVNALNANISDMNARIAALDEDDQMAVKLAQAKVAAGDLVKAKKLLSIVDDQEVVKYILSGVTSVAAKIDVRQGEIKATIARLTANNDRLLSDVNNTTDPKKKRSIMSMVSRNNMEIKSLRAKLGAYQNFNPQQIPNRAALLAETNEKIAALIQKGASVTQAANKAISEIVGITPQQKVAIKQQIVEEIADGGTPAYVVQQALQQHIQQQIPQQVVPQYASTQQQKPAQQIIDEILNDVDSNGIADDDDAAIDDLLASLS